MVFKTSSQTTLFILPLLTLAIITALILKRCTLNNLIHKDIE